MGAGDMACQYITYTQARTQLLESHASACAAAASSDTTPPPMPDVEEMLTYRSSADAPSPRLPSLPQSLLAASPLWWNPTRTLAMCATGLLAGGPWQFSLVRISEHLFPGRLPRAIASKIAINMCTAPIGISSTFFLTNFFQGHASAPALRRIRDDMPRTFVTGACYWPFVSFLNLRFVEVAYRPVVGAAAGALWNIYVSAQANSKPAAAEAATTSTATVALAAAAAPLLPADTILPAQL